MDNKVVTTIARTLYDAGIATLRFNFRGVGGSAGVYDAGEGETADAVRIAEWGAQRWPGRRLVLAGFSFGCYVALRVAQDRSLARLITIAPPLERFDFSVLRAPLCPWLVVQGDADEVVEPRAVAAWARSLHPPPQLVLMLGAGHFFHGRLADLRDTVSDAIRSD